MDSVRSSGATQQQQRKADFNEIFLENINDVAESLAQIMMICGIHQAKAKASIPIVVKTFLHYDNIRHQIEKLPEKRIGKTDLIHQLADRCLMSRLEATLSYSIIKRAFKAFYHGTCERGIRSPLIEAQLIHAQECMWLHAAKRTAQIFATFEGLFFSAQRSYESQIKCIYKELHDRMKQRVQPRSSKQKDGYAYVSIDMVRPYPTGKLKKSSKNDKPIAANKCAKFPKPCDVICKRLNMRESEDSLESITRLRSSKNMGTILSTLGTDLLQNQKCDCPQLICNCDIDYVTRVLMSDCSQGPFKVEWILDEGESEAAPCIQPPGDRDHVCPVDCDAISQPCSECECDCRGICECVCESSQIETDGSAEDLAASESLEQVDFENVAVDMTDINERIPSPFYAGCRVPLAVHEATAESKDNQAGKNDSSGDSKDSSSLSSTTIYYVSSNEDQDTTKQPEE